MAWLSGLSKTNVWELTFFPAANADSSIAVSSHIVVAMISSPLTVNGATDGRALFRVTNKGDNVCFLMLVFGDGIVSTLTGNNGVKRLSSAPPDASKLYKGVVTSVGDDVIIDDVVDIVVKLFPTVLLTVSTESVEGGVSVLAKLLEELVLAAVL